ncbi:hypothetical protein ACRC7T_09440 [Segnochrobactraceae bacterium EtOH-i3]
MPASTPRSHVPAILLVVLEVEPPAPGHLISALATAGFRVGLLTPAPGIRPETAAWRGISVFPLGDSRSASHVSARLAGAMAELRPVLVVPCDGPALAVLQTIVQRGHGGSGKPTAGMIATLIDSLGDPCCFAALLLHDDALALVRGLGLPTVASRHARTAAAIRQAASDLGWPAHLGPAFDEVSRSGSLCHNPREAEAALARLFRRPSRLAALMHRLTDRDWDAAAAGVAVREVIPGSPATLITVAWRGQILATAPRFGGPVTGRDRPSAINGMETTAARYIATTGASGFLGFTFTVATDSGLPYFTGLHQHPDRLCGPESGPVLADALAAVFQVSPGQTRPVLRAGETRCPSERTGLPARPRLDGRAVAARLLGLMPGPATAL